MTESLHQMMARLRAEYLAQVPARLEELEAAIEGFERQGSPVREHLIRLFHRLAGSAGAYGFAEVTRRCRDAEERLARGLEPAQAAVLREALVEVRGEFGPSRPP